MSSLRVFITCLGSAILHDALEDTDTITADLKEFLLTVMNDTDAKHTLTLVTELTDVYIKDHYPRMNRRQRKAKEVIRIENIGAEAQTIKYADIIGNADAAMASQDADSAAVYLNECIALFEKMKRGNKELRNAAVDGVRKEVDQLKIHGQH